MVVVRHRKWLMLRPISRLGPRRGCRRTAGVRWLRLLLLLWLLLLRTTRRALSAILSLG